MKRLTRSVIAACAWTGSLAMSVGWAPACAQNAGSDGITFKPERVSLWATGFQCRSARVRAINNTGSAISNPSFSLEDSPVFSLDKFGRKCPDPLEPGKFCQRAELPSGRQRHWSPNGLKTSYFAMQHGSTVIDPCCA